MKAKGTQFTDDARQVEYYGYDKRLGTHGSMFREGQTDVIPASKQPLGLLGAPETIHRESDPTQAYYSAHKYYEPLEAERKGWNWAHQTTNVHSNWGRGLGRPVVHEVAPKPGSTVDLDPYTKEWRRPDAGSLVSNKGLDITDTHWIPPVSEAHQRGGVVGNQGTLPSVNWNQFGPNDLTQRNWTPVMSSVQSRYEAPSEEAAPSQLPGQTSLWDED